MGARWNIDNDQKAIRDWHALAYLILMVISTFKEPNQGVHRNVIGLK